MKKHGRSWKNLNTVYAKMIPEKPDYFLGKVLIFWC